MTETDRWGAHLEYFKLSIALTTALIAAAAAIYFDFAKIPTDNISRFLLLASVVLFSITLVSSVWGVAALSNHLLHAGRGNWALVQLRGVVRNLTFAVDRGDDNEDRSDRGLLCILGYNRGHQSR